MGNFFIYKPVIAVMAVIKKMLRVGDGICF